MDLKFRNKYPKTNLYYFLSPVEFCLVLSSFVWFCLDLQAIFTITDNFSTEYKTLLSHHSFVKKLLTDKDNHDKYKR